MDKESSEKNQRQGTDKKQWEDIIRKWSEKLIKESIIRRQ